jgi:hypothetical protein
MQRPAHHPKCISTQLFTKRSAMRQAINTLINFIQEAREAHLEIANQ